MTIPLTYLLILYTLAAFLGFLFTFFNVFHIAKFGLQSSKTTIIITVYILSFLAVLTLSALLIMQFDWSQTITLPNFFSTRPISLEG